VTSGATGRAKLVEIDGIDGAALAAAWSGPDQAERR
jgi:hypothetical protein